MGDVPAWERCPALGAPVESRRCQGAGRGQGEGKRGWQLGKRWLNSAQQQNLWDILLSLVLSCLALEVLLPHWAQWVSRQQRGEGSWTLKHIQVWLQGALTEARVTTDWRNWFQRSGPTTSRSPSNKATLKGYEGQIVSKLDKRVICQHF